MRLSTKIIIGIILSIFLLSLLHIISFSFTDRKHYQKIFLDRSIKIPQMDKTGINIESYRVITVASKRSDNEGGFYIYFTNEENGLFIQPAASTDEENSLFIPKALYDCISTKSNNDTLTLTINLDEVRDKYGTIDEANAKSNHSLSSSIPVSGFNLYLHTSNINVINQLNGVQTLISNIVAESIKISSKGDVTIDSCKANVIEPYSKRKLNVSNSFAKVLILDLDEINNWKIDNCDIEARNYTGGRPNHSITITGDESEKINWLPKNKEAELNLKFKGSAAKINFDTQSISE